MSQGSKKGSLVSLVKTKTSQFGKSSVVSAATASSSVFKRGITYIAGSGGRPTTASVAEEVDLPVGCHGETLSLVTMRQHEELESEVITELQVGTVVEILEVGAGRRLRVQAGTAVGWISSKTRLNEPLVVRRRAEMDFVMEDFEAGGHHEVKSTVTVRAGEQLDSDFVSELRPGTVVRILELGSLNKRRARIATERLEGWMSLATKNGDLLVGKLTDGSRDQGGGLKGSSSTKIKEMLEAARSGNLEVLKRIVESKGGVLSKFCSRPNLNCSDVRGKTALIYAAAFGNQEVVQYLLTKTREIDVNALDDTLKSALHHASKRARTRRKTEYDGVQTDIITMLLQAGIHLDARDHNGCTALMFGVANGDEAVVKKLITAKANVQMRDYEGHTALDYARNFCHSSVAKLLLNAGAVDEEAEHSEAEHEDEHPAHGQTEGEAEAGCEAVGMPQQL